MAPRTRVLRPLRTRRVWPRGKANPLWNLSCWRRRFDPFTTVRGRRPFRMCANWPPLASHPAWSSLLLPLRPGVRGTFGCAVSNGGGCPASPAASVRYPLQAEGLSGEFQPRCYSVMNGKAFDASRDHVGPGRDGGYAAHHQLDGRPLVRGANSIAELPVFPASVNARVGEQVG